MRQTTFVTRRLLPATQVNSAGKVLQAVPDIHNDKLLQVYAAKAVELDLPPRKPGASIRRSLGGGIARGTGDHGIARHGSDSTGVRRVEVAVLKGLEGYDSSLRAAHSYRSAPNAQLCCALIELTPSSESAARMCVKVAEGILSQALSDSSQTLSFWREDLIGDAPFLPCWELRDCVSS